MQGDQPVLKGRRPSRAPARWPKSPHLVPKILAHLIFSQILAHLTFPQILAQGKKRHRSCSYCSADDSSRIFVPSTNYYSWNFSWQVTYDFPNLGISAYHAHILWVLQNLKIPKTRNNFSKIVQSCPINVQSIISSQQNSEIFCSFAREKLCFFSERQSVSIVSNLLN